MVPTKIQNLCITKTIPCRTPSLKLQNLYCQPKYCFLTPTNPNVFGRVPTQTLYTKETKTTWLPNKFCGTQHQAQQPNNSFLFLLLYLSRSLSSCHPQEGACHHEHLLPRCAIMNTFYQGVPAAFSPRAQCKPCPFSKDYRAQVESNIASQVPPALSTRTAVNPFNKD